MTSPERQQADMIPKAEVKQKPDNEWHLDKRVPIALIITLLLQFGAGVWWASNANERLDQVERRLEGFADRSDAMRGQINEQGQSIAVLLSRIDDTNTNLDRLRGEVATTNNLLRQMLQERR
jgi:peptidoglycan hydrolase CwlO-like protein